MAAARISGVHPVETKEPCYLIELVINGDAGEIDFGGFTQPIDGKDSSYWQVAYDERKVSSGGEESVYVFFFHYLDFAQPMQSPFRPLALPRPTPRPPRLGFIEYEKP